MFRVHRVWSLLQPQRRRHPVMSALLGLVVVCALAVLLSVGVVIGLTVFVGSVLWRMLRPVASMSHARVAPAATDADVIDAEFRVLRKPPHRILNH